MEKSFFPTSGKIEVLKSISLELYAAESIALVGASGSGKSTLLSLLAGLDTASNGNIFFQKNNTSSIINFSEAKEKDLREIRSCLSIVFQQNYLMEHLNILENVMLPLEIRDKKEKKNIIEKKAFDLLEQVGLQNRIKSFPYQISGGEAQRAGIARALIQEPNIVFADEPTGNLDTNNGKKVAELLFHLVKKKSTSLILVTHNEELANKCDKKLRLVEGKLLKLR